jgi:hypothetical protein
VSKLEGVAAVLPQLATLRLNRVFLKGVSVRIEAVTTTAEASCPDCGFVARRVHSRYVRRLVDWGVGGREVLIELTVRRFFCDRTQCARKTFAEQVPGVTVRHGRHTDLAAQYLQAVAAALGGRAGARLVAGLATPVSRMTLLRVTRRVPDAATATPRVLGVDEFAQPARTPLRHRPGRHGDPPAGRRAPPTAPRRPSPPGWGPSWRRGGVPRPVR